MKSPRGAEMASTNNTSFDSALDCLDWLHTQIRLEEQQPISLKMMTPRGSPTIPQREISTTWFDDRYCERYPDFECSPGSRRYPDYFSFKDNDMKQRKKRLVRPMKNFLVCVRKLMTKLSCLEPEEGEYALPTEVHSAPAALGLCLEHEEGEYALPTEVHSAPAALGMCLEHEEGEYALPTKVHFAPALGFGYDSPDERDSTHKHHSDVKYDEMCADIELLIMEITLLKIFVAFARRWTRFLCFGHEEGEINVLSAIKDLVSSVDNQIRSAYLTSGALGAWSEFGGFRERIQFLGTYIKDLYIISVDSHHLMGNPDPNPRLLMDLIYSSLEILLDGIAFPYSPEYEEYYAQLKTLQEKLMFLKNFVSFASMQLQGGVEHMQLLTHVEFVALNAARLIYMYWFGRSDKQASNKIKSEISQLLQKKINPADVDPQVRETYIQALATSKLSRLSHTFALEKNSHMVVADFIHSLHGILNDLLEFGNTPINKQMKKLYEGLMFLNKLIGEWQEKFNALDDEMKDLIGVVVCDAGIVIFSFSVNEMKDGLAKETDNALCHLLKVLRFVVEEIAQIYATKSLSSFSFPKTNELGSLDFLLENLKELETCETDSIAFLKDQILIVQQDMVFLRSFLQNIAEQRNQNIKLQDLWAHVMEIAYKVEFLIDSIMVGNELDCPSLLFDSITEKINILKSKAPEIYDRVRHDNQAQGVSKNSIHMPSRVSTTALDEVLVGVDGEVKTIIDDLTRGSMQLDIVSIVGMPGVGKTTLAGRVYRDPSIMYHFHIRAWCTASQVYSKQSLLLQILGDTAKTNEDDLAEELYKHLKGKRFLVVFDDVWDIEALNLLKVSFPTDENGSRILLTSRCQFKFDSKPRHLSPLADEQSWELLQNKLFGTKSCPPTLTDVGRHIAQSCKGLPLTIVIVAGILTSIELDCWEEVAKSLSSSTVIGTEQCMKTLELSYIHLPDCLKSCLLYFGAFQEGQDIPVQRLLWLWISEGFVQKTEAKSLEDVADEYLMDLIGRSLVIVTRQRSIGGIKACRVHDLLHEFCVAKAKEESFLQIFHGYNELCTSHRLCICSRTIFHGNNEDPEESQLFFTGLRSLLSSLNGLYSATEHEYSFIFQRSKLLRVLDFEEVYLGQNFPREIELLVHLRYLAIQCNLTSIPSGIVKLSRLETFLIVASSIDIALPNTIWSMEKLRHLCARTRFRGGHIGFILPIYDPEGSPALYHLENFTLAIQSPLHSVQEIMGKLPSIRRLKWVSRNSPQNCNEILVLHFWDRLESLHVVGFRGVELVFPQNLKKLTLSHYNQPWSKIATIGNLPNLEVLKLLYRAFVGETWEIKEGEFPKLRVLKLESLNVVRWTASCDNFPPLEKLVLYKCGKLEDVPSCLGESSTIEMIEVRWCHQSAVGLVKQIQEEQMEMGNKSLKIVIHQ